MPCNTCFWLVNQEIDLPEFVLRFGEDTKRFCRKMDRYGLGRVIWCKKQQLPREFYIESAHLAKLELPDCPFRSVEEGEE